jgi:hypothetical protein
MGNYYDSRQPYQFYTATVGWQTLRSYLPTWVSQSVEWATPMGATVPSLIISWRVASQ